MDLRQTKEFSQYMKLSGWIVERTDSCYIYLRKLPLLPPLIMKIQYPTPPIPFEKIEKLAKKYKPLQIQIQPLKVEPGFKKYGYRLSKGVGHVTRTIQLNLIQPEKEILAQMKKDARYGIRKAEKQALQIIEVKDLAKFHQVWKKSVGWNRWVLSLQSLKLLKRAFGEKAVFLTTTPDYHDMIHGSEIIAGTVVLIAGKTAYYYYAFTSKGGRKKFAQYLLVWEAIKEAKKRGCKIFDFEGIYDPRFPQKSWKGFSHFKKSFGGKEVGYPGCFVKYKFFF